MGSFTEFKTDLRQIIYALETTVDLVGMNDNDHGKRVGYIASQIAHQIGFSEQTMQFSFELGLIHDCGVSTDQVQTQLINHFDWENAYIHCHVGYQLLNGFEPLRRYAIPIRYHHTPWDKLDSAGISPQDARMANLIFLSDRIDVQSAAHYGKDILLAKKYIIESIERHSGTYFDPLLVEAFLMLERSEAFWISLEERHIDRYTWDMGRFDSPITLTLPQLRYFSLMIAYIIDQKSPFTAQHSARVGCLARYLARAYGLFEETCDKIEIAGFLHDIGKLHMPDKLLEKPGALSEAERSIICQHSYETYEILRHIEGLGEISLWASYHHEGINGAGYPFHPAERDLGIEARILSVADIFQALVQDRPYRKGMPLDKVLHILEGYANNRKLDHSIVKLTKEHGEKCFEIAKGLAEENRYSEEPLVSLEDVKSENLSFTQAS